MNIHIPSLDRRRWLLTGVLVLLVFVTSTVVYSHEALKPHVADAITKIKDTAIETYEQWTEPDSGVSLEADFFTNEIFEPYPRADFTIYKDLPPAHLDQFAKDRRVFATMYCSRKQTPEDPYLAAVQQMIWRILWSDWASKHPIVIFVCPFIKTETRDLFKAQGAWVEELPLISVPTEQKLGFSRWVDQFSKLNLWKFTQYDMIAYLDTDALPVANPDSVFDSAQTQHCKTDMLEEVDAETFAKVGDEFCSYLFAGVLDNNIFSTAEFQDINGGLLVLRPNLHHHERLVRNAKRTSEYNADYMEQSYLSSALAFGPRSPFPAQELSPIYNFGGANSARLAAAAEPFEETDNPGRVVTQEPADFILGSPISADRVLIIHDKMWLWTTFVNKNPLVPYWNQMWAVDWMRMCRFYDWDLWPSARTLGHKPAFGVIKVTAEEVRQGKVAIEPKSDSNDDSP